MAEAVAGITKPTVSLIIGGTHSGTSIAVASDTTYMLKMVSKHL